MRVALVVEFSVLVARGRMRHRFDFCGQGIGFGGFALSSIEADERTCGGQIKRIDGDGALEMRPR